MKKEYEKAIMEVEVFSDGLYTTQVTSTQTNLCDVEQIDCFSACQQACFVAR